MKTTYHLFVSVLLIAVVLSCTNGSSKSSANTSQDEILAAFPRLQAKHTSTDSSQLGSAQNKFVHQKYSLQGEDDLYTGTLTRDQWNDSLKIEGTFKNGQLQKFASWYPNGKMNSKMLVQPSNKEIQYKTTTWYASGELKSKYNNQTGEKYFKSGSLKTSWDNRSATDYWKNGNRKVYWPLKDSSRNSILDGPFKRWHQNGQLSVEGLYKNGRKDGKWIHHDSLGAVEKVIIYEEGIKDSTITDI